MPAHVCNQTKCDPLPLLHRRQVRARALASLPRASASRTVLRVDGGMAASDWTMQRLADLLDVPVDRPSVLETTALGAAYLAGLQAGLYPPPDRFAKRWALDRRFAPRMAADERTRRVALWRDAVGRTLSSDLVPASVRTERGGPT